MIKTKLAIFDLDGTLFDTRNVNYCAYKEAIESYGYCIDYKYYCDFCNGKHYNDFLPQITTTNQKILLDIHNRKKEAYKKYINKAIPNIHLINIIRLIKSEYYISLVTTASKKNCNEILKAFGVYQLFDLILTQDDVNETKPNPQGFLKAIEYFNVLKKDTVIFEDSDSGIEAAKRSGAKYMAVYGYN